MAHLESVEAYLEGKGPAGVALFRAFQELVERFGPAEVAPSCSIVYWKRKRIFAGAWVERTRLELTSTSSATPSIPASWRRSRSPSA
jgi:hypothetical protein